MNRPGGKIQLFAFASMLAAVLTTPVHAEDAAREAARKVDEGNRLLSEKNFSEALSAYDAARTALPESPEVAYNRGIALFRMGEFAKSASAFQDALKTDKPEFDAKVKYNLGRCAHESALSKRDKLDEAVNDLGKAISFYKDAAALNERDADAVHNRAEAERLLGFLEKKLKEQQEKKEKKDSPSSQPSSQPDEKPTTQPQEKQQTSQPTSQPQSDEQKDEKGDKQQDQKGQEQKGDNEKDQKDQEQQGQEKDARDKKGGKESKDQKGKGDKSQAQGDDSEKSDKQQEEQAGAEGEQKEAKMRPEDAEGLMQEARDQERARREVKRARMMRMRGRVPVAKDW